MVLERAVRCAALFVFMVCTPFLASAQDITLTARTDGFSLSGDFLSFDGRYYRVMTEFGALTVDGDRVICSGDACVDVDTYAPELRISGSATLGDTLLPSMIEAFAFEIGAAFERTVSEGNISYVLTDRTTETPVATLNIVLSTSAQGFVDLILNKADVAMSIREVADQEADALIKEGHGDLRKSGRSQVIGLDALVVMHGETDRVHIDASSADASYVVTSPSNDWLAVLNENLGLDSAQVMHQKQASVDLDENTIAFAPYSLSDQRVHPSLVGSCGFAIAASRLTIKAEDYPLTVPLLLYLPERRQHPLIRQFLNFIRSDAGQLVVRRSGFIELTSERIPVSQQGARFAASIPRAGTHVPLSDLQSMVDVIGVAQRLSMTFRLASGSSILDAQSKSNIQQLAAEIRRGRFDGKTLILAGFSDGQGDAQLNKELSLKRANGVLSDLNRTVGADELTDLKIETYGFGEALPMACDDTRWGRNVNRRVEVWVR